MGFAGMLMFLSGLAPSTLPPSTLSCVLDHPIVDVHLMTCCCFDCSVRVPTGRGAVSCSVSEFVYFVHYGCGYNCLAYEIFE